MIFSYTYNTGLVPCAIESNLIILKNLYQDAGWVKNILII